MHAEVTEVALAPVGMPQDRGVRVDEPDARVVEARQDGLGVVGLP